MSETASQLPPDIEALHALLAAARVERDAAIAERDAAIAERNQALSQNDRLRHLLRQLQRAQFGRRSEKLDGDQLGLALEDIEQVIAANEADDDKKDAVAARTRAEKRRANRGALPAHLPRVDVTIEPEDTNRPCCRTPMHVIGEETSQRLDVIPAHRRPTQPGVSFRSLRTGTWLVFPTTLATSSSAANFACGSHWNSWWGQRVAAAAADRVHAQSRHDHTRHRYCHPTESLGDGARCSLRSTSA